MDGPNEPGELDRELKGGLREVAPILDQGSAPTARAAFRSDLRAKFLSGDFAAESSEASSTDRVAAALDGSEPCGTETDQGLEPARDLRLLLDKYGVPRARMMFRLRLQRQFAAQAGDENLRSTEEPKARAPRTLKLAKPAAQRRPRRAREQAPPKPRVTRLQLVVPLLAAAAAVVMMVFGPFGLFGPTAPGWWAWTKQDLQHLRIDGQSLAGLDASEVADRLSSAARVEAVGGDVRMGYGRLFAVELGDGSVMELSAIGSEPGDAIELAGTQGAFRFVTGPDFKTQSRKLLFAAPDAVVEVVGTTFGVDVFDGEGSCICCVEGEIEVSPFDSGSHKHLAAHPVQADNMSFVFTDRSKMPMGGAVMDDHLPAIQCLADDCDALWR
ncbi:MAG: hypothetical protein ACI841_003214 [Planctomycetota bacterium]|jgi:hypothetical protein